jgi:acyl-CoA reductase-like NAD-dependent aldehyde dehydrogenase
VNVVETEIERFLGTSPVPLYVDGSWRSARAGAVVEVRQPADGSLLATVAAGEGADIDDAVAAAARAFRRVRRALRR